MFTYFSEEYQLFFKCDLPDTWWLFLLESPRTRVDETEAFCDAVLLHRVSSNTNKSCQTLEKVIRAEFIWVQRMQFRCVCVCVFIDLYKKEICGGNTRMLFKKLPVKLALKIKQMDSSRDSVCLYRRMTVSLILKISVNLFKMRMSMCN